MYSSFLGIEISKRALFAHQRAQQNISHNVSNTETPGYSRQRVILESTFTNYGMGTNAQLGTGVKVSDVNRIRDDFIDMQFRKEYSNLGRWDIQSDILKQVEAVFNEPSDIGISSVFNKFWEGLETLSKDAASMEARETVKERGVTLANTINHAYSQLNEIQGDINYRISVKVGEINSIARQIADINQQIMEMETTGTSAADLRDRRDLLLDDLSNLVQFEAYEDENGLFTVNVGGAILVKGNDAATMEFDPSKNDSKIMWKEYNSEVRILSGELKGLLELRDEKVGHYITELEKFTEGFVEAFNEQHKQGYDLHGNPGLDFFEYHEDSTDKLISVNSKIIADPAKIAAAGDSAGIPSDNRNALKLTEFRSKPIKFAGSTKEYSIDDYYGALVSKLGVDSQEATRAADSQLFMVSQLNERRKAISSVSLDEEMIKMIAHFHGYNASSRVVTTIDEMLETVVNRMGITGR